VADVWKRAGELEALGAAGQLVTQLLPSCRIDWPGVAALARLGAALVAGVRRFEVAIGAEQLAFDQAKTVEKVHGDGGDRSDHGLANAVAEVAQIVLARNGAVEPGEEPVASSLITVVQIAAKLGVIDLLIDFGSHCEEHEAGGVVARATAGAIGRRTQGAGEAEVQGDADEPTEAAVDLALRRHRNGMGRACIV